MPSLNRLLDTDPQPQEAASPQVLRSGQRQRYASEVAVPRVLANAPTC